MKKKHFSYDYEYKQEDILTALMLNDRMQEDLEELVEFSQSNPPRGSVNWVVAPGSLPQRPFHCKGAMDIEQKFCSEFLSRKLPGISTFFEQNFCSNNFFLNKSETTFMFQGISPSTCAPALQRNILRVHSSFCSEI